MLYLFRLWLRRVLALEEKHPVRGFRLRDASFDGKGVQTGIQEGNWQQLRDFVYPEHTATQVLRQVRALGLRTPADSMLIVRRDRDDR